MSSRPPASSISSAEAGRLRLVDSIDNLAEHARSGMAPDRFFGALLDRAMQPGGATLARLWRQTPEGGWQPVGGLPAHETLDAASIEQRQVWLTEVSTEEQPRQVSTLPGNCHDEAHTAIPHGSLFSPIRHAGQTVGILETVHDRQAAQLSSDTRQFFAALCEITADFLSQHELQQLRQARTTWQKWDQYTQRLWQSLDLATVCAAISNDGRILVACDRVSVLVRRGRSFCLKSVSGVERIEPRSTATRSLEALARLGAKHGQSMWRSAEPAGLAGQDSSLSEMIERHLRDSGARGVGLVPVYAKRDERDQTPPCAVLIFEHFQPLDDLAGWQSRGESLANRSGLTLRAAWERSHIPWLGLWQRLPALLFRPLTLLVLTLLAGITAALFWTPSEMTVTGPAELWPAHRRNVFASTSGIIDQILVVHGDEVELDQPLLVLRDPVLEMDSPRIIGEIATVNERLKGVQAARLTGSTTSDAASRARQLTADEEELKARLRTLDLQRKLLEERRASLTLRSPIAGKVLTWDVAQQLSARPVERGQVLLTIGETTGPWVMEVRVADKDAGHLLRARQASTPELEVDFQLTADPGRTHRGHVQDVSLSSETDDDLRSHLRVVVAWERDQMEQPRPGATAIPRIRCGQRSLGYVWLHDLIDAIRTRLLF